MKRLPPLKALQAFEAAGRHLSFSAAARELNVTPGAISQQIRQLEEALDVRLFKRLHRAVVLTESGQRFLPPVSRGFEQLGEAVALLHDTREDGPLTITTASSFASNWLIPRLDRFKSRYPDVDVRIDTSSRLVDFAHEEIDVGIRFGDGDYPDLDTAFLFSYALIPVCTPELARRGEGLETIADLASHTLLHSDFRDADSAYPDWVMWLRAAGEELPNVGHGITFNQTDQLFRAVLDGQGIGLLPNVLAAPEIAAGRLVQPFAADLPIEMGYYVVTSPGKARLAKVRAFRAWVLEASAYLREDHREREGGAVEASDDASLPARRPGS
ncbi:MAG: transcriptional regulator GcvA [Gammaproteobacteria bacterium]|nr:transcriptional regulator GcvA [Gammaproteobacteria bacterium]